MRRFFNHVGQGDTTQSADVKTNVKMPPSQSKKRTRDTLDKSEKKKTPPSQNKKRPQDAAILQNCVGKNVAKIFGTDVYYGKIGSYSKALGGLWHIVFADGDEEDMDRAEVTQALKLWSKKNEKNVIHIT